MTKRHERIWWVKDGTIDVESFSFSRGSFMVENGPRNIQDSGPDLIVVVSGENEDHSVKLPVFQAKGTAEVRRSVIVKSYPADVRAEPAATKRVIAAPWLGLRGVIPIVAGTRYYEDVVKPTMSDIQYQYYSALMRNADKEALAIKYFGLIRIILTVVVSPVRRLVGWFRGALAG